MRFNRDSTIGGLISLVKPLWLPYISLYALVIGGVVLEMLPPMITRNIVDVGFGHHDVAQLIKDISLMAVIMISAACIIFIGDCLNARLGHRVVHALRVKLISHLYRLPISFYVEHTEGSIVNRATNDVAALEPLFSSVARRVFACVISIIVVLIFMFTLDWRFALLTLAWLPCVVLPFRAACKSLYSVSRKTRETRDELNATVMNTLSMSGALHLKAFSTEDMETAYFSERSEAVMQADIGYTTLLRRINASVYLGSSGAPLLLWLVGGLMVYHGALSLGTLVAFVALQANFFQPALTLMGDEAQILSSRAVLDRVFDYLRLDTENAPSDAEAEPVAAAVPAMSRGDVTFDNVSFGFDPSDDILSSISFNIGAGQMLGIVGASGAGKTTIAYLLMRLYDHRAGNILIDGSDTRRLRVDQIRRHIGFVSQDPYLLHESVRNNIRYGTPSASDEEVRNAAIMAKLHEYIETLPEGYDTIVGERGFKLSGGQRQRIALARVILRRPKIMILDEATSALDTITELSVQEAIKSLEHSCTRIVIAHRLSTIVDADRIIVLGERRIAENGHHGELLAKDGLYASLFRAQQRAAAVAAELA